MKMLNYMQIISIVWIGQLPFVGMHLNHSMTSFLKCPGITLSSSNHLHITRDWSEAVDAVVS